MKHLKLFEEFEESSEMKNVELYYERWMKEFDVVEDCEGNGPGTIFRGDSGYIDNYEELIERLKNDIHESSWIDGPTKWIDDVEFFRVHNDETGEVEELATFIKGLSVTFD